MTDPANLDLASARNALQAGELRAADLLAACLHRIDRHEPTLNAIFWLDRDAGTAQAEAADRLRARGGVLPRLHGVPLAHKDLFLRHGQRQTAGSDFWRNHVSGITATVLQRLDQAGSIAFAGLHMAELAQNPTGHNPHFGDCLNPWGHARIPGGSSSGSAVAVAAGYTSASMGSDTGGSIRLPAACCGVTGLKPTHGLISRAGAVPLCASLDAMGPLGRTARDCAILLGVVAGGDAADPTSSRAAVPDYEAALDGDLRGQRVGVPEGWLLADAPDDIRAAFAAALAVLVERGARLVGLPPPALAAAIAYGGTVARVEAASLYAAWMRTQPQRFAPHVAARLYPGYAIPATYYVEAMARRPAVLAAFVAEVFGGVDILATPTLRARVPSRAETDVDHGPEGTERRFFAVGGNVRPFNYLGLPALSLPIGLDAEGLPIGLQLIGRPFAEARLLRAADAYQRVCGPPPRPPLGP